MVTREPFEAAPDVRSIGLRLHPLDVGWDVRGEGVVVVVPLGAEPLRVSCADEDGARVVLSGPASEVREALRSLGYVVHAPATSWGTCGTCGRYGLPVGEVRCSVCRGGEP